MGADGAGRLNVQQERAVTHEPRGSLVVVAGPGSGKTKVIVHRIAHLIGHCGAAPHAIVLVTFTNKAAREMQRRVRALLGDDQAAAVRTGTFHSLCAQFLRKYAQLLGLRNTFTIVDANESRAMIKRVLDDLKIVDFAVDQAVSFISAVKNRSRSVKQPADGKVDEALALRRDVMREYDARLRKDNCLDFDDLLVFAERLFVGHPHVIRDIEHVLVDEFQDTNELQYEITRALCQHARSLTVVGDPDQSIYGWRHATAANLTARLLADFPAGTMIDLDLNYRSTSHIVQASQALIESEPRRRKRAFGTENAVGLPVTVCEPFADGDAEAAFVADEIVRLRSASQGLLDYDDFSVLLRMNAMSRRFEEALSQRGIAYRVVGGTRFFDRADVKNCLAYLRLANNPVDVPSCDRIINVPPRGLGQVTVDALHAAARGKGISLYEAAEQVANKRLALPGVRRVSDLAGFVAVIASLQRMMAQGARIADMLRHLVADIKYEQFLRTRHKDDAETRWENVQELLSYAEEFEKRFEARGVAGREVLTAFLDSAVIESDAGREGQQQKQGDNEPSKLVTLSTMHAAKGLEWPVVFVPGVEDGTIPHKRAAETEGGIDEERRLLYVAMTRAQALLYVLSAERRMLAGETSSRHQSPFLSALLRSAPTSRRRYGSTGSSLISSCTSDPPTLSSGALLEMEHLLRRSAFAEKPPADSHPDYTYQPPPEVTARAGGARLVRDSSLENADVPWPAKRNRLMSHFDGEFDDEDRFSGDIIDEHSLPVTMPASAPVTGVAAFDARRAARVKAAMDGGDVAAGGALFSGFVAASSLRRSTSDSKVPLGVQYSAASAPHRHDTLTTRLPPLQPAIGAVAQVARSAASPLKRAHSATAGNAKLTAFFARTPTKKEH